jgi:hypothetical protein
MIGDRFDPFCYYVYQLSMHHSCRKNINNKHTAKFHGFVKPAPGCTNLEQVHDPHPRFDSEDAPLVENIARKVFHTLQCPSMVGDNETLVKLIKLNLSLSLT